MALIIIETQEDVCIVLGQIENNVSIIKNESIDPPKNEIMPLEVIPALQEIEI